MKLLPLLVLAISYFDIKAMWKKGLKKEIAFFVIIASLTLAYGYYYLVNKNTTSIIGRFFDLVGFEF